MKKKLMVACYVPALFGLFATFAVGASGCKKKEEEPPLPTPVAVATPAPAPVPVAIVTEEDASFPIEDAAPDAKKVVRSAPADVAGLRACCTALQQNAASMPPPNNTYALQAAQLCQNMVTAIASGSATKAGALGSIGSIMKGANLPPACK